jgi:MFS transporter, DHA2 family, multidrug resistance protein
MRSDLRNDPRRWWALGALAITALTVGLDATVLNLALPTLARDLHASTGDLQWFVDSYNLAFAAALLPGGLVGDRWGRRRMIVLALGLFGVASLACAYAQGAGQLMAARILLGLAAAFLVPLSAATLPVLFHAQERPRALGVWVTATALGFPIGPIVGGWLLDRYWWGSVFLINVPVVLIALIAVVSLLPESRDPDPAPLDLVGVLLSCLGLVGVTYGAIDAGENGWGQARVLVLLIGGALLLAAFGWHQRTRARQGRRPLVDPSLLAEPGFTWGTILGTLVSFVMFGVLFTVPQLFQSVQGHSALASGVRLLPLALGLAVGARVGPRLLPRAGAPAVVAAGFVVLASALALGTLTRTGSGLLLIESWIGLAGLGIGLSLPTAMDAALAALDPERAGVGSAVLMAVRQVGGTLGVAVLGSVLGQAYRSHLDEGGAARAVPSAALTPLRDGVASGMEVSRTVGSARLTDLVRESFLTGMDHVFLTCAAGALVAVVISVALPSRRRAAASEDRAIQENETVN